MWLEPFTIYPNGPNRIMYGFSRGMYMIVIYVCAILISLFSFFASFSYQLYASSWLQPAESCSFSEKALRNYTLTPRPPPSLQDPRPRISIDLSRYAFAYTCIYRIAGFFCGRKLSRISCLWRFAKVLSAKIYF